MMVFLLVSRDAAARTRASTPRYVSSVTVVDCAVHHPLSPCDGHSAEGSAAAGIGDGLHNSATTAPPKKKKGHRRTLSKTKRLVLDGIDTSLDSLMRMPAVPVRAVHLKKRHRACFWRLKRLACCLGASRQTTTPLSYDDVADLDAVLSDDGADIDASVASAAQRWRARGACHDSLREAVELGGSGSGTSSTRCLGEDPPATEDASPKAATTDEAKPLSRERREMDETEDTDETVMNSSSESDQDQIALLSTDVNPADLEGPSPSPCADSNVWAEASSVSNRRASDASQESDSGITSRSPSDASAHPLPESEGSSTPVEVGRTSDDAPGDDHDHGDEGGGEGENDAAATVWPEPPTKGCMKVLTLVESLRKCSDGDAAQHGDGLFGPRGERIRLSLVGSFLGRENGCEGHNDGTSAVEVTIRGPATVRFCTVEVREYRQTVGDNPACSSGPPIALDWWDGDTSRIKSMTVDEYERERDETRRREDATSTEKRKKRHWRDLEIPEHVRVDMLLGLGHSVEDLFRADTQKTKDQILRERTLGNLRYAPIAEIFEGIRLKYTARADGHADPVEKMVVVAQAG